MFRELLSIFRADNPLHAMAASFKEMLQLACDMTLSAGGFCFGEKTLAEDRTQIYQDDVRVNKLERESPSRSLKVISVGYLSEVEKGG